MNKYSDLFLDEPKVSTSKYSDLFLDEPEEEEVLEGERPPLASLVSKPWLAKVMEKGEEFAYNIMRDVPGFGASFPMMGMPPPLKDVAGLAGKAMGPIREKIEGLPFLAPLRDLEQRAFGEKAVGEPLFEPEVLPQSQQEQIYNILKPLITGEVSVPEAALGVVESTPVVGAVPRAIRDPESLLERPLPYLMDLAILLGGVGALAKGKRTRIKPVEAKAVPPSPRAEPPDIFPGLREKVVPEIAPGPPEGIMEAAFGLEKPKVKPKKIVVGKEELALKKKLKAEGVTEEPAPVVAKGGEIPKGKKIPPAEYFKHTERHDKVSLEALKPVEEPFPFTYHGEEFFAFREVIPQFEKPATRKWQVTHKASGRRITQAGKSKVDAIKLAKERIDEMGVPKLKTAIKEVMADIIPFEEAKAKGWVPERFTRSLEEIKAELAKTTDQSKINRLEQEALDMGYDYGDLIAEVTYAPKGGPERAFYPKKTTGPSRVSPFKIKEKTLPERIQIRASLLKQVAEAKKKAPKELPEWQEKKLEEAQRPVRKGFRPDEEEAWPIQRVTFKANGATYTIINTKKHLAAFEEQIKGAYPVRGVVAEYPELAKKGRKVRVTRKKAEPVELGFLGTPEAAKALGESVVGGAKEISRLTSEMTKKMKVKPEIRAGVKEAKEAMIEHDRQTRRAESTSKLFEKVIKDVVPDKGRQMEMVHAYEHKMKGARWEGLTDLEQSMVEWVAKEKAKLNKFIEENKVLEMMPESENINHIFHHWINPETGVPYKGMYGKFSKGLPQAKQRVIPTYESGIKKGLKPATTNIGKLVGLEWEAATRAHQSREMFKTLHNIGAEKGAEIQLMKGKPAKPIRMVERWDLLGKQGLTEDYVRYSHPALDKAIIFKDANGMLVKLKGAVGVRKELFPFVKAYLESPNYGSLSKLNFATKSLKLGFSMFHVMSLGMQELANFRIPFKNIPRGLREVRNLGPELRLLHQEGLELFKGYEDIGYRNKFFEGEQTWKKAGNFVTKPIEGMRTFIFDIVQPGMKASFALDKYNELLPKYLKRGMTKEQCARDVVKAADGHFSGEHYKRSLLETNRFMAKMYFSPQARKTWQAALLSPTWQREHLLVAKNVAKSFMPDRFIRKIGLSEIGPIKGEFRKYLLGATMLIGAVDLWNMYLTHKMDGEAKHLWQNPEGKGFAIRAPWNEPGYEVEVKDDKGNVKLKKDGQPMIRRVKGGPGYIRPLKSVFEVAEWVKTPFKKFIYKLSPIVTATGRQFWPSKYQKEYKGWPDMPRRAWDFVTDVGTPISASQIGSWAMGKKTPQAAAIPFFGFPTSKLSIKQTNKIYYERLAAIQKKHGRYSDEWRKVKVEFEDMGYKFSEKSYRAYWEEKKEPTRGLLGIFGMP